MMANINTNISFLLEDIEDTEDNLNYTEDKLYSLIDDTSNIKNNLIYYIEKSVFTGEDETY